MVEQDEVGNQPVQRHRGLPWPVWIEEMLVTEVLELTLKSLQGLNLTAERDIRDYHCTPHFRVKSGKVMLLTQHHRTDLSKNSDTRKLISQV